MKRVGGSKKIQTPRNTTRLATSVPSVKVTFHTGTTVTAEQRYIGNTTLPIEPIGESSGGEVLESLSNDFLNALDDAPGAIPAYETTPACDEKGNEKTEQMRESVAHMNDLKKKQSTFLRIMLSRHHHSQLLTPCSCGGKDQHDKFLLRRVACDDCLQAELLCRQCWVNKHRTMPAHWAFVWNQAERFFEKYDFSRVLKNGAIRMRHNGEGCPDAEVGHSFTLVERNGIHATAIAFCGCKTETSPDGKKHALSHYEQLMQAGIFPGSVKDPGTGYTLGLLEYYRQQRSQGKGSAYNFVLVLQRQADRFFAGGVPDIYKNFLVITRFYEFLQIILESGEAHGLDDPLPKEVDVPYPNRPPGFLGVNCAACPEPGVNMPLVVKVPRYLRHTISLNSTLDGNFKANLFFKRDDGSDTALTDGNMYFPKQAEFDNIAATYVIPEEDKEVPCKAHIGSIRHQGQQKYGTTAVSGVVGCACDHAVLASLIDMLKGEAFALGTYAQREMLRHKNTPPHAPETQTPMVQSYDSYCSFVVNQVKRATDLFPDEIWLHDLLAKVDGQIPADHINGHGLNCQTLWQAVYFACRGHFHGETAEVIWAFLNALGSSTRQMTGAARHDTINFVMHAWNMLKYLRQAQLLAAERLDALRLFELHMAVVEELSRQHAKEVGAWSRLPRHTTTDASGELCSVYQHKSTKALSVESTLAAMISTEQDKLKQAGELDAGTSVAQWVHDGMTIERQQLLAIALLRNHQEHPLQETWDSITKLRDSLNLHLKKFRVRQREIYPRLTLSALDVDEPEVTAIQLPSYRMKHGQRQKHIRGGDELDSELRQAEIQLRCTQAESGVFAVRDASLALSAVKKARELDYRGQGGITRSQRNLQKAELMKQFEIDMYNTARTALIHLGHMEKDAVDPFPPLTLRDTRRKETHLHRATGDSRLFDGTAWYLQSGVTIADAAVTSTLPHGSDSEGDQPELLAGTQSLKRSGFKHGQRTPKRLRDIAPDNVEVGLSEAEESDPEMSPSKGGRTEEETTGKKGKKGKGKGKKKGDGWIWMENLMRGQPQSEEKLAAYKMESDQVQWFRAEAEMYRWLEQYERKHAELMRVISRYRRDSEVWRGLADREEALNGTNGATTFARMQAAMHRRLELNATTLFKSADSGAHHDWVAATSFDDLVERIDRWRDAVFKWMDDLGIHRAYKNF
ncbi:hypothetical protein C8F04DRAFT_1296032 [Mycena alexandri]|uniref:CxC2-like cysteine cluster KDZ transposase-associated domain-containing protein n=1 Tax=Mycena alexandri TaxID=1745969 RepID=A0AAD6SHG6_9AGAR|nr:hypothetical protein C8F04DRAFT_1296032 [Mycena alexandri]